MLNYLKPLAILATITAPISAAAQDSDWTGFYVGAGVGFSNISTIVVDETTASYGLHAGYDFDFGKYVIGGEIEYSTAEYSVGGVDADADTFRLKARGGYDLGKTLVYGVLGYSNIDADGGGDVDAFTLGLGAAYRITNHVELGLEYLHDFAENDVDVDVLTARIAYRF